jgi:myo-inositol 2-dehydrogenase/D-chiro-inositol 1-dehydrogenase
MEMLNMTTPSPKPTHRRDFLKTTAASASVLALASAPLVHADSNDTIRVGLIGCGQRGTGAAEQALLADRNAKLWAMGDTFRDRLDSSLTTLRNRPAVRGKISVQGRCFTGFNAYQDVINSGVHVVLLCSPPGFRPQHLRAAVAANKHIFAEKPVAVDAPGVRTVLAACQDARQRNLSIVSGLCYRYDPPKRELMRRIHDGGVGQILALHTTFNTGGLWMHPRQPAWSDMEWQVRNWLYFTWLSGDHNVEQHVHSLDKMAWAMNNQYPESCVGLGGRQVRSGAEYGHIFDHHAVVYNYPNGVKCFSYCRQHEGVANEVTDFVIGTTGKATVMRHIIHNHKGVESWRYQGAQPSMYQVEHNELFASIRAGQPINNGEYMCKSTLMGIMGRMATYTGRVITWQQALQSQEDLMPPRLEWGALPVAPVARPGITQFS